MGRVIEALATLPDGAARELVPGDIARWGVVRVGDEIVMDLMKSACGIDYTGAAQEIQTHEVDGVRIPFASASLLGRTKHPTHREKGLMDLRFLAEWFRVRDLPVPD